MNSAHLVEVAQRMACESQALTEAVISWQLITRPYLDGSRGIARWSGLSDKTVREIAGPVGGLSEFKFLWTRTRGHASATVEEREEMQLRFHSNTRIDYRSTSPKNLQASGPLGGALALREGEEKIMEGNAVVGARIGDRAREVLVNGMKTLATLTEMNTLTGPGQILTMLDPGLDIWAEVEEGNEVKTAVPPLGRRAWSLAVLCGLEDVVLSVSDIEALTGLSKRGVQALLARMAKADPVLVRKVRKGRTFEYGIYWASPFRRDGDWWDNCFDRDLIRKARAAKDRKVQEASARRGTPAGCIAYRLSMANPKRAEYLAANPLPADADEVWRVFAEAGDEMALYEHLRAQEAEAGLIPNSPKNLVESKEAYSASTPQPRPAQDSLEAAVVSQEKLAEMRKRIIAGSLR
ncbi:MULTISPECIES: hypothetical protein [Streptomyces]|uniref:hypothetical protein n=1 Tax=Streptomyces TaxID=1883 RepID=UPI000CF2430F|nr:MULTISPECIES: hypothetical protein [Streptomyces]PPS71980.1 hypothetical protein BV882_20165 [Streptomyces sp. 46]